jgi:mannose-6-phosphate isomerase-like protein (cupin superfamily)
MAERGWRLVNLRDVPGAADLPPPEDGVTAEEREAARAEIRGDMTAKVDVPGYPDPKAKWHALRRFLGVSAFGVAATEGEAGKALIWTHHEMPYEQEELYLVVEGRVRFHCDGEEVDAGVGDVLYVQPEVVRGAIALETPTMLFMVGGKLGTYEPPIWAGDWRPPDEWLAAHRG